MYDIQSIELPVNYHVAYDYIANPHNLPEWANAFASVTGNKAVLRTPNGEVPIQLDVQANNKLGVVDWIMTFPDGSVGKACSRLTSMGEDSCIYAFTLFAPPVPLEQLEGALAEQSKILASELVKLKGIVCPALA